jgi:UDP-galactopyranose mutase
MYDYLVVGTGLYGSVFARELKLAGCSVLMVERNAQVGGNVRTICQNGILVHLHGPHSFHTKSKKIWDYVNSITEFWPYRHQVKARYEKNIYTLPFNLATYYEMWGCTTPAEAFQELEKQRVHIPNPSNLEEYALSTIGKDLYHKLVYGYTKKQWQRSPKDLPVSILRRLPLRMDFNIDYHNDWYQGVPTKGYTHLIEQLVDGVDIRLNDEFKLAGWRKFARKLVYSGSIDDLFDACYGHLEYRGLEFKHLELEGDFQGCSQMNYTSEDIPHTRIVEHKHFHHKKTDNTIITYEYPIEWEPGMTRYYPIDDAKNRALYDRYKELVKKEGNIRVGGRLGKFIYFNMDQVVAQALTDVKKELCVE